MEAPAVVVDRALPHGLAEKWEEAGLLLPGLG